MAQQATSIFNPGNSIDNAFGNIYGMFGSNLSGGGGGAFGGAPQPVSGADNSLTAQQRGTANLAGQAAPTAFSIGQGMLGTGMGVAQGGLNVMGTGLQTIQPSIDYASRLMAADPTTVSMAAGGYATDVSKNLSNLLNQTRALPSGGYGALVAQQAPQAAAAQVGNFELGLQPQAEQMLSQLGGEQAQIGQGMAGVGTNIGQLGTTLTGQGLSGLVNLYNALIGKQQINQQATPLTAFDQFASGVSNLAGAAGGVMTGIGNMTGANAPTSYISYGSGGYPA